MSEGFQLPEMRRIDSRKSPLEMAEGLQHLEDFIWLDSAGNLRPGDDSTLSLITARAERRLIGSLADTSSLERAMNKWSVADETSELDFPRGGLFGTIDYEGAFSFGVYPELLVYHHATDTWYEQGSLSQAWKESGFRESAKIEQPQAEQSQESYEASVRKIHDYIAAGDLYQVNLCQRFSSQVSEQGNLFDLYKCLRKSTPAPMAAYLRQGDREVLSSSPETFLRFTGREVFTRPIKGTRPRFSDPLLDQQAAYELRTSEKEIAELVMITDLLRNDLGKVCEFGSVEVTEMLKLESYEQVYHLVSTVKGVLKHEVGQIEALSACSPGGSITGAPKIRSMQVIDELESSPRGLYTGSIGYFGFNGISQFNIVIRTLIREANLLHYHVGAGIVADSEPTAEFHETLHKAKGLRQALEQFA